MANPLDDEASVEQRCARIRGRMVWILSQLEGDGTALADMADLKSLSAAGSPGRVGQEQLKAQQEAHERELEEELEKQTARLKREHEAELEEMRARLASQHASEMTALRSLSRQAPSRSTHCGG